MEQEDRRETHGMRESQREAGGKTEELNENGDGRTVEVEKTE